MGPSYLRNRLLLGSAVAACLAIIPTSEVSAQCGPQCQEVCQGGSGGGCPGGGGAGERRERQQPAWQVAFQQSYALNDAGIAAWNRGDLAAAEAYFLQAAQGNPGDSNIRRNLAAVRARILDIAGVAAQTRGDWAAAESYYQQSLKQTPRDAVRRANLAYVRAVERNASGLAAQSRGDWAAAAAYYQQALEYAPNDPTVRSNLAAAKAYPLNIAGVAAQTRGDWAAAEAYFQKALKENPSDPTIRNNLALARAGPLAAAGLVAVNRSDWAAAEADYQQALEKAPNDPTIRSNLANVRSRQALSAYKQGNYAASLSFLQLELAGRDPGDPRIEITRGYIAKVEAKIDDAQRGEQQKQQDNGAEANTQQSIAAPEAGSMNSASALKDAVADGPSDSKTKRGAFNSKVADPKLEAPNEQTCRKASCATDTSAGDQLKSAAASNSLTENYDIGGASRAGSLSHPSDYVRDNSLDPATFTDKQKNAPGMHEALTHLTGLKVQRERVEADLKRLIDERNHASPEKMAELNGKVSEAEKAHNTILSATASAEDKVRKIKREIGTEVGPAPPTPAPAKKN